MSSLRFLSLTQVVGRRLTAARLAPRVALLSTDRAATATDTEPHSPPESGGEQPAAVAEDSEAALSEPSKPDDAAHQAEFDAASAPSISQLADLIAEKDVKLTEVTDKYARALAEMENVRARSRRDVDNAYKYSIQGFAKDLLEVADNLQRAVVNVNPASLASNSELKTLFEGLQMTDSGLGKVLQKYGVEKMQTSAGSAFDPNFHTALFQTESSEAVPGTIASVVSTGYLFKDRVLRPAAVGTFKQAPATPSSSKSD